MKKKYSLKAYKDFLKHSFENQEISLVIDSKIEIMDNEKIKECSILGDATFSDGQTIGFFEFQSQEHIDVENNRVGFNELLKKKSQEGFYDGAIAIFYNPSKPEVFRMSFLKFNYDEKLKQHVTSTKRFTFILGENIPVKTAKAQLDNMNTKSLQTITEAFSVEPVSEEFFKGYKSLYKNLWEDVITFPNENFTGKEVAGFVKKLFGRITFLWFLQKKGWLGVDKLSNNWYGAIVFFYKI